MDETVSGEAASNSAGAWGKLTVRNDRGDRGNVGIIRSPVRASILPDLEPSRFDREHRFTARTTVHQAALLLCCKKGSRGRLMDLIQCQKICPIPHLSDDYSLVARSVANDHSLLFLFVERAGESAVASTFQSGIGTFPRTKMDVPGRSCLLRQLRDHWKQSSCPNST